MNVSEFLANLNQQGVELWANNDKLSIRSPKGSLTPEQRTELAVRKLEILAFLHENVEASTLPLEQGLSLQTIGRLIGGLTDSTAKCKQPVIDPRAMAQKLTVTFRPLPKGYSNEEIVSFREELEAKPREYGVKIAPWEQATTEFKYVFTIPLTQWERNVSTRVVKADVDAVIDVDKPVYLTKKLGICAAENIYKLYSNFVLKKQEISVSRIAKLSSWAEDHAAKHIEDPIKTQVIMLTKLDNDFVNPHLLYETKIKIGLNTLIRTFSELVIGVSSAKVSVLNMNLSDSIFSKEETDKFGLNSLIPKVFVPIMPLPMSRFEIGEYNPYQSKYAEKLVSLGKALAKTGLFPPGSKLSEVIKRKSHRDIVNVIVNGRTGVSYGFVAYAEDPQYVGEQEVNENEWENLSSIEGFSSDEVRQNGIGRRYIKTKVGSENIFKQIPDVWIVSSRSGSNKTNLSLGSRAISF